MMMAYSWKGLTNVHGLKSIFIYTVSNFLGLLYDDFYCISVMWHGGDEPVTLLRWSRSPGCFGSSLQLTCIRVGCLSSSSWQCSIDLNVVQVRWVGSQWSTDVSVSKPSGSRFATVGRCQVLLAKGNWHLHEACQQMETWSALKSPGRCVCWLWSC